MGSYQMRNPRSNNYYNRSHDFQQQQSMRPRQEQDRIDLERYRELAKKDPKFRPACQFMEGGRKRTRKTNRRISHALSQLIDTHGMSFEDVEEAIDGYRTHGTLRTIYHGEIHCFSRSTVRALAGMLTKVLERIENEQGDLATVEV